MKRAHLAGLFAATAALVAGLAIAGPGAGGTTPLTNAEHFFWAQGQFAPSPDALTNDIIYHGGNVGTSNPIGVQVKPAMYLVYWGTEWAQGFQTADTNGKLYSSSTLMNYL